MDDSMKSGGSSGKGGDFERAMAGRVSQWLSRGKRDDLLCRTVGSGAQFTSTGRGIPGDLRAQESVIAFRFCEKYVIECKWWKDLEIIHFLQSKGDLYDAMQKVQKEASRKTKSWMLLAKQNNRHELLFMPYDAPGLCAVSLKVHHLFEGAVTLLDFRTFIAVVDPDKFINEELRKR